jgi:carboxyl-terminal processing protease
MQRVFRPLAVFSIATGASLALGLQLMVSGARGSDGPHFGGGGFFPGYDLAKLQLVEPTLYHVDESYVDPSRVNWEQMYVAALDAIERRVPVVMFSREPGGQIVAAEIGDFRTVLEVPTVDSRPELQEQLGRIAALIEQHLDPADIPMRDDAKGDPMAEIEYAAINGMLRTLDPHSILLPPDDARQMDVENQGEFGGLGITIEIDPVDGRLMISYPLKDTPAYTAGLQAEDRILRIDGESTTNLSLDEAIDRLRGPVGAEVELEIARKGVADPFAVTVQRELISIHPVQGELMDGGIGYVSIEGFHELVERDLDEELAKLSRKAGGDLEGLILDLRGNPGGFLNQAVKVADTFLESGEIVSTIDRDGRRADREDAQRDNEPTWPIVVLVDANSASASEIVAGALRYNERAVIIGERTFGKGSVQNLHPFVDESKLKLTISKYLTAGDRSLQAIGIPADIELEPAIVPPVGAETGIRLFYRERATREADLDRSFERVSLQVDEPAYRVRYVAPDHGKRRSDGPDLTDPQVVLARDVLKAAPGWRRSDVLIAAAQVVARYQKAGNDDLVRELALHGIDWSNGAAYPRGGALPLEVSLDLNGSSSAGELTAGRSATVALTVKNTSSQTLYRVAAVVDDHDLLGGREFLFGAIPAGATRRFEQQIDVAEGWPTEQSPVRFDFRDAGDGLLGGWTAEVRVASQPLPAFAWRWSVSDPRGDGDGVLDLGEQIDVKLEVRNTGAGPATEPYARLRNRSGTRVDLVDGTLVPGTLRTADGAACPEAAPAPVAPKPGPPAAARPACARVLGPGEAWSGTFTLVAKGADAPDAAADPLTVELALGDGTGYDQAAVLRSSLADAFGERDDITLTPGAALPSSGAEEPPRIEVTRVPPPRVESGHTTVSGLVTDDRGLDHVMVFVGENKVFFEGAGTAPAGSAAQPGLLRSVPFTADVALQPGSNVITVLATDGQGFRTSRSLVVWAAGPAEVAKAGTP